MSLILQNVICIFTRRLLYSCHNVPTVRYAYVISEGNARSHLGGKLVGQYNLPRSTPSGHLSSLSQLGDSG